MEKEGEEAVASSGLRREMGRIGPGNFRTISLELDAESGELAALKLFN